MHLVHRKKLSHSVGKMRSYEKIFPARPRSRSAVGEISVWRGNFQLIWTEIFCWWKLPLWRDPVEIIIPPRRDNVSHMNSPLLQNYNFLISGFPWYDSASRVRNILLESNYVVCSEITSQLHLLEQLVNI